MDAGDEDDTQSVLQALERDLRSVEARSIAFEGPNDSKREDEHSEAGSDDLSQIPCCAPQRLPCEIVCHNLTWPIWVKFLPVGRDERCAKILVGFLLH